MLQCGERLSSSVTSIVTFALGRTVTDDDDDDDKALSLTVSELFNANVTQWLT